jgi:hypothetical protein
MSPASDKPTDQELLQTLHTRYTNPVLSLYDPVPAVMLMLVLPEYPLKNHITLDCIDFLSDNKYGTIISRITNECSKPDRAPTDGKLAFVVQSTYDQAREIMR